MKKSLRRKLLLSGLAMGVAALSLASTTYAWFVQNTTVDANNIDVTVNVPQALTISKNESTGFGKDVNFDGSYILAPVAKDNDGAFWRVKDNELVDAIDGKVYDVIDHDSDPLTPAQRTEIAFNAADPNTTYYEVTTNGYYDFTYYLRYDGEAATTDVNGVLTYSVNDDDAIIGAVKVEMKVGTGNWETLGVSYATSQKTLTLDTLTLSAATPLAVTIRVWLDGTSSFCANSQISSAHVFSHDVQYTIANQA